MHAVSIQRYSLKDQLMSVENLTIIIIISTTAERQHKFDSIYPSPGLLHLLLSSITAPVYVLHLDSSSYMHSERERAATPITLAVTLFRRGWFSAQRV
jgi:hypothetical protein